MQGMPNEQYFLDHVQPCAQELRKLLDHLAQLGPNHDGTHVALYRELTAPLSDRWAQIDVAKFEPDFAAGLDAARQAAERYFVQVREFQRRRREQDWT